MGLPDWEVSGNDKLDHEVRNLLENARRGIVLETQGGNITARRSCKSVETVAIPLHILTSPNVVTKFIRLL